MKRNMIETVMGGTVLVVAALFMYVAYTTAQVRTPPGYQVSASFAKVGGLPVGSDVRISGIKVGTVTGRRLDPTTFNAEITMTIAHDIKLPVDTVAAITSEGALGGKYLQLDPGKSSNVIPSGGSITQTRSFRSLEDQVGEIIFLATSKSGDQPPAE
jgi:phospholipid/cholesterol/gamma-HCH transport system substrate-binding protein